MTLSPNHYAALVEALSGLAAASEALRMAPHAWDVGVPLAEAELGRARLAFDHLKRCLQGAPPEAGCDMLDAGAMRVEELRKLAEEAVVEQGPDAKLLLVVRGQYTSAPKRRQLWRGGPRAAVEELIGEGLVVSIGASELLEILRREEIVFVDARPRREGRHHADD